MFTSMIAIIVLGGAGLAALLTALTGRTAEQAALTSGKRLSLLILGILAWVSAVLVYARSNQDPAAGNSLAKAWSGSSNRQAPAAVSLQNQDLGRRIPETPIATLAAKPADADPSDDTLSPSAAALEQQAEVEAEIEPALPEQLVQVSGTEKPLSAPIVAAPESVARQPARLIATPLPRYSATYAAPTTTDLAPVRRNASTAVASVPRKPRPVAPKKPKPLPEQIANSKGTTIHILNTLGADETQEKLTLSIEGRPLANFEVNTAKPSVHVPLVLPRPGVLNYTLSGTSLRDGYTRVAGKGCIEMTNQSSFEVRRVNGSDELYLHRVATRHY
jgi:hypothetical protein